MNSYGHPHAETLNNLRALGIKLYRTDEQGSIIATSNGTDVTWNCAPTETWKAGESTQSSEEKVKKDKNTQQVEKTEITQKEEDTVVEAAAPVSDSTTYICNTNTMKFHIPSCSSVNQMKESNKLQVNCSRDELLNQGYVPCKRCNPYLIHPYSSDYQYSNLMPSNLLIRKMSLEHQPYNCKSLYIAGEILNDTLKFIWSEYKNKFVNNNEPILDVLDNKYSEVIYPEYLYIEKNDIEIFEIAEL